MIKYAPLIIGAQFVFICALSYFLYGSYTQWEAKTVVKRDTVETVKRDTIWKKLDFLSEFTDIEPDEVIEEGRQDTVVKYDTLRIFVNPDTRKYTEKFSRDLASGTVTSVVRGQLVSQNVSLSVSLPKIRTLKTQKVTEKITKTQVGKWRVVASADIFFGDGIELVSPGVGLQRPTEFSVFYKYDVINGWHGGSVNVPISLIF